MNLRLQSLNVEDDLGVPYLPVGCTLTGRLAVTCSTISTARGLGMGVGVTNRGACQCSIMMMLIRMKMSKLVNLWRFWEVCMFYLRIKISLSHVNATQHL